MKQCVKCKTEKSLDSFSKDVSRNDGLQNKCKSCVAAYRKQNRAAYLGYNRKWYRKNPEKAVAQTKRWQQKNPDLVEKLIARAKERNLIKSLQLKNEAIELFIQNREVILSGLKQNLKHYPEQHRRFLKFCPEYAEAWRLTEKSRLKEQSKLYRRTHKDRIKKREQNYRKRNPQVAILSRKRNYKKYTAARAHRNSLRRTKKMKATPSWLTKLHKEQIRLFFEAAKGCPWFSGEKLHVDHIIPLQGKDVCGLHVPWNLQLLPEKENIAKGNRLVS